MKAELETVTEFEEDTKPESGRRRNDPEVIAGRYQVMGVLGRGGMGSAYHVRDTNDGAEFALKRLTVDTTSTASQPVVELFEREFHTLNQLAHPRIVRAFDYGHDDGHPYYTMELLSGGDLHTLAPVAWPEVCMIAYEVCSALALLHSRRLVHRDLSPRNVRRTADGKAKLIDFGLLCPMGAVGTVAGTPPYTAPEGITSMTLDGRGDLFSLGATLYYALTRKVAFPARRFEQVRDLWRSNPPAPAKLVPEIPEALDRLVLEMMRIDVGSRPKSAAEVMDRLRPLLRETPDEALAISGAYLAAPALVGRAGAIVRVRKQMIRTTRTRGGGFIFSGSAGTGRSRMLDAFVLEAKLYGALAARAGATDAASGPFGVARALAQQLHDGATSHSAELAGRHPDVHRLLFDGQALNRPSQLAIADLGRHGHARSEVQAALRTWLHGLAERRTLALAVDDFEQVDEPSMALLAGLSIDAHDRRLVYAIATDADRPLTGHPAFQILTEQALVAEVSALTEAETQALVTALFGDVPHVQGLAHEVHRLSGGKPRECMQLAQHMVDRGAVSYVHGTWSLPAQVAPSLLPARMEETLATELAALSELARELGQLLALSVHQRLTRLELCAMSGAGSAEVDDALDALRRARLLAGSPRGYTLCHAAARDRLMASLEPATEARLHDLLAAQYRTGQAGPLVVAYHALQGSEPSAGLTFLLDRARDSESRERLSLEDAREISYPIAARVIAKALDVAVACDRPEPDRMRLWVMLAGMAAHGEDADYYYRVPRDWLAGTQRDAGLQFLPELAGERDPATRAMQLFIRATQAYEADPSAHAWSPTDAIKQMVGYVVFSIAVGVRALDLELLDSLPPILLPFAPLSPLVAAMQRNAAATRRHRLGQLEAARDAFAQVIADVDAIEDPNVGYVDQIRAALVQTCTEIDAALGLLDDRTLELDDVDPNQRVGAAYVRKVAALHRGDWEAAEAHRHQAELIALQVNQGGMFSTCGEELEAHAFARDLTGLRAVRFDIGRLADKYPGWQPLRHVADAHYHRVLGEPQAALAACQAARACQANARLVSPWLAHADAIEVELLAQQGEGDKALALGLSALARAEGDGHHHFARTLSLSVALAESSIGAHAAALARVDGVVATQEQMGVKGLLRGRSHEYAARIAIAARDERVFKHHALAAAEAYRPGESSVLGALHEHLLEQARAAGLMEEGDGSTLSVADGDATLHELKTAMADCADERQRAERALTLLCEQARDCRGYLFLLVDGALSLRATNRGPQASETDAEAALTFAQQQLELERDDEVCTLAGGAVTGGGGEQTTFCGPSGAVYQAITLRAHHAGQLAVVGIAILSAAYQDRDNLDALSGPLAKSLMDSGDYSPVKAA